ncbi:hypothetical protein D3C84_910600 [compost metagenome]
MTPCTQQSLNESFGSAKAKQALTDLTRRREQKLLNAVGAHLNKETLAIEDIISLKGRMRCEVNKADQSESFYLDDTLLVTFLQPEFIVDGSAIMVKQGYGPVGV